MEIKNENNLPFLDVLVTKEFDGSISYEDFRKKTHIDRCFLAHSHHRPAHKTVVLNTLVTGSLHIFDKKPLLQTSLIYRQHRDIS